MKRTLYLAAILLLFASCRHDSQPQNQQTGNTLQLVKSFRLSDISTLQLCRSADTDNYITLQLVDDDGKISEIMGMGNADFDSDSIILHPLLLADSLPAYALYTYDRTSTYGSTTCYLVHPYLKDFPDQFWTLFRIPFDILNIADVNGDGYSEIIRYPDPRHSDSSVYAFHDGILTSLPLSK